MAIDRDFLADQVWQGTMIPGYSMVPPGIANYVKDAPKLDYSDDMLEREDKAKELLKGSRRGAEYAFHRASLQYV